MTVVPPEFDRQRVAALSSPDKQLPYAAHLKSGEPYATLLKQNYHTAASGGFGVLARDARAIQAAGTSPAPGLDLNDDNLYYNAGPGTTAAEYWAKVDLPKPTRDIVQLRKDLVEWGYCLVAEAFSAEQLKAVRDRVYEQADGERLAGVANWSGGAAAPGEKLPRTQLVHCLLNKGDLFRRVFEFEQEAIQGGAVIEQILSEALGDDYITSTYLSLITAQYSFPQNLHQDQGSAPFQTPEGPMSCNTLIMLDDFNVETGGTLVIPGSHKIVTRGPLREPLPPAINVQGKAGTALIFEGRLLHGAGVNRSPNRRAALILDSRAHWMRAQELFILSLAPDVIPKLSPKALARLGFRPRGMGGAEGTYTEFQLAHRMAIAEGTFKPVRELGPGSPREKLAEEYTYRYTETGARQGPHQPDVLPEIKDKFKGVKARVPKGDVGKETGLLGHKL